MSSAPLRVKFWGVRGSIPTPDPERCETGSNTPCVEIALDGHRPVVLDAGTGIRPFGLDLLQRDGHGGGVAFVLLSHFHWDHVQGLPFLPQIYRPGWAVALHSARRRQELERVLRTLTSQPFFADESAIRADLSCHDTSREALGLEGLSIRAFPLHHPGGAHGFRVEAAGRSIVYITDHEHGDEEMDAAVREAARGADLLIWDSMYTPDDYDAHRGWGHSTWLEGTRVAAESGVGELILFHHDPQRSDADVARIESDARGEFRNARAAREGLVLSLTARGDQPAAR